MHPQTRHLNVHSGFTLHQIVLALFPELPENSFSATLVIFTNCFPPLNGLMVSVDHGNFIPVEIRHASDTHLDGDVVIEFEVDFD